ncbi:hypothetical protein [Salidesulfovibrio onnuriiensis]|uniref:hypothetical protein n=1 Tax=Salidesulfovibrio onnuriiensis TaxID=2583823 RepID=UPI0011CAF4A8|nr:hypothetical protein [Salidesulfovibrio onnuriiensis]
MIRALCKLCDISNRLNLQDIAYLMFITGGVLALFSLVVWPLILVSPVLFALGLVMAFSKKTCTACGLPPEHTQDSG